MSEAKVRFLTIDREPCPPDQKPARFSFVCIGFNRNKPRKLVELSPTMCRDLLIAEGPHSFAHGIKRDPQAQNGGKPQWEWDGNRAEPTFSPSINCEMHCGWHGYIRGGRCVTSVGQDEPELGK